MLRRIVPGRRPSDSAASRMPFEIWRKAACVLRTIGNSAYSASAMNAGTVPMRPVSGIRNARRASAGMVWMTPVAPMTAAPTDGSFAATMPSGMPTAMLAASDKNTRPDVHASGGRSPDRTVFARSRSRRRALSSRLDRRRAMASRRLRRMPQPPWRNPCRRSPPPRSCVASRYRRYAQTATASPSRFLEVAAADRRDAEEPRHSAGNTCDRRAVRSVRTCRSWRRWSRRR